MNVLMNNTICKNMTLNDICDDVMIWKLFPYIKFYRLEHKISKVSSRFCLLFHIYKNKLVSNNYVSIDKLISRHMIYKLDYHVEEGLHHQTFSQYIILCKLCNKKFARKYMVEYITCSKCKYKLRTKNKPDCSIM